MSKEDLTLDNLQWLTGYSKKFSFFIILRFDSKSFVRSFFDLRINIFQFRI